MTEVVLRCIKRRTGNCGPVEGDSCTRRYHDTYQNGGYWATPTGWLVVALGKVNGAAADQLPGEYTAFVRANRAKGAPYE